MALDLSAAYPSQTVTDAAYPYGKARNVITPGDGNGTPWEEQLVNDWLGFFQGVLVAGDVTPSESPDTATSSQYVEAIRKMGTLTISPSAISSSQNNWAPTGISTAAVLRVSNDTVNAGLTGITSACDRKHKILINVGTNPFPLFHGSGSSTAGNRFITATGGTAYVLAGEAAWLLYDDTSAAWRVLFRLPESRTLEPSSLSASQNDYNPSGWRLASKVFLTATTDVDITGFDAAAGDGSSGFEQKFVINASAQNITLIHESASSTAANRITTTDSADIVLRPREAAVLIYGSATPRWRAFPLRPYAFSGSITVAGDVTIDDDVLYTAAKERISFLTLADGKLAQASTSWQYNGRAQDNWGAGNTVNSDDVIVFPLILPKGAIIKSAEIQYQASSLNAGAIVSVGLRRLTPQTGAVTTIASDEASDTSIADGFHQLTLSTFSTLTSDADRTVTPGNRTYQLIVKNDDITAGALVLHWVKITWDDPGLTNHWQ